MERIIVIGCPGAGKSTFSRKLRDKLNLPLYYLDQLWHKADRTNYTRDEFDLALFKILKEKLWIIDGNYNRTLRNRLESCDTVFLLDYPTSLCLESAKKRIGKKREDMPWVEESLDPEFESWILSFRDEQLPYIYSLLQEFKNKVNIVIFKTREESEQFLLTLNS